MSTSSPDGKLFFTEWFSTIFQTMPTFTPKRILDVGPGYGVYGRIIRQVEKQKGFEPLCYIEGVELFKPNIENVNFDLKSIYDKIRHQDIRDFSKECMDKYDLIIFGDVLEHITKPEALEVWKCMKPLAKWLLVSLPITVPNRAWSIYYNQGKHEWSENPYDEHKYNWSYYELIEEMGPFLWIAPYQMVGVFIAEGDLK